MFKLHHWLTDFDEMILLNFMVRESIEFQPPKKKKKKKKIPLIQNKEDTHGVSRRVWHRHELEVSVVVSTLYSLITNLVNGGFARDINGDAILMMFVRVGQVFPFWRRRRECRLQPQHQRVFDGACVIWWAHHHHH